MKLKELCSEHLYSYHLDLAINIVLSLPVSCPALHQLYHIILLYCSPNTDFFIFHTKSFFFFSFKNIQETKMMYKDVQVEYKVILRWCLLVAPLLKPPFDPGLLHTLIILPVG